MNLVISERGTFLALRSERLQLRHPTQETQEVALRDLESVSVTTTACTLRRKSSTVSPARSRISTLS